MIFTSKFKLNDGKEYEIAILGKLNGSDGVLYFKIKEMLGSADVLSALSDDGSLCYITASEDHPLPVAESGCINITAVYNSFAPYLGTTLPEGIYKQISDTINEKYNLGVTPNDMLEFKEGCEILKEYLSKPVNFRIDAALTSLKDLEVKKVIDKVNTGSHGLNFVNSGLNKTLKMATPSSKVFIRLPNYATVSSGSYTLPTKDEVMPDYSNPEYETVHYKNFASIEDLPIIEGSPRNNRLAIQDNEREFYNALKEYLHYGIQQQYSKSLEEVEMTELIESDVFEYLKDLAERILRFGWQHTGVIPEEIEEFSGDSSETGEESKETIQVYAMMKSEGSKPFASGTVKLRNYIESESGKNREAIAEIIIKLLRWGNRKPSKIVVDNGMCDLDLNTFRIMESKESFDESEIERIGNAQYVLVSAIYATGTFMDHTYLNNIGVNINTMHYPIGILCTRTHKSRTGDKKRLQYVYMSIADVLEILETAPEEIKGITVTSDGKYIVEKPYGEEEYERYKTTLERAVAQINMDVDQESVAVVTDKVIEHALAVNANTADLGYLKILNKYLYSMSTNADLGRLNYISVEECADKAVLGKSPEQLAAANIAHNLLPGILHSMQDCEAIMDTKGEVDLEDMLNVYAINNIKYPIDLTLEDVEEEKEEPKVDTSSVENKLKRLSIVQENTEDNSNEVGGMIMSLKEQLGNVMYMPVPEGATLFPVKVKEYTEEVTDKGKKIKNYTGREIAVAFYCQLKTETGVKYIFSTLDETSGVKKLNIDKETILPEGVAALPLQDIVPVLFNDVGRLLQGKESATKIRFSNEAAMITVINHLNKANIQL